MKFLQVEFFFTWNNFCNKNSNKNTTLNSS